MNRMFCYGVPEVFFIILTLHRCDRNFHIYIVIGMISKAFRLGMRIMYYDSHFEIHSIRIRNTIQYILHMTLAL